MVITVHLVAVRAAYLAPARVLPLEESSDTFQEQLGPGSFLSPHLLVRNKGAI